MPYSCQLQFGTSGSKGTPVGAGNTCRAMGLEMSQTSRLTMVQTIMRAPPGNFSGGRSTMAEYSVRSRGSMGPVMSTLLFRKAAGSCGAGTMLGKPFKGHYFVGVHDEAEGRADTFEARGMQFRAVHAVDAVFDDDDGIITNVGCSRGGKHAGVGVHAGHQDRVDAVGAQQEIEVGSKEAVVALLGVDDEIAGVQQLRHHGAAGAAHDVVPHRILARVVRLLGAGAPSN